VWGGLIIRRRSVAERGGCFQRRLHVCLFVSVCVCVCVFVCLIVRTISSERLNVGQSNLAIRYAVQKSRPSSKVKVKGQGYEGQKKTKKTAESSPLTMRSRACIVARPYAASIKGRYHCVATQGVTSYAGGKISA